MRGQILVVVVLACATHSDGQEYLALVRSIDLPQVEGRIDHLAVDLANQRLFVAALGNNTVEVVDLRAGVRARSLSGFHEPQGIAVPPDGTVVAVANGASGDVHLLDRADLRRLNAISLGEDADNVRYDPGAKRLFVGYGASAIAAINASDGRRLSEVKLAGHPESFQLERSGSRVFVNVPTARHVAVIDRLSMTLVATWPVTDAESNYPMTLDDVDRRLFVGCRRPAKLIAYDLSSGKPVTAIEIVGDTDDLFFDSTRRRVYVSGGQGYIDVLQVKDPDHLTRVARVPTAAGARTSLFVPEQGRLYLAVPHRGAQRAAIRVYEVRD
jgi:DNA-binding beta-propeller fold protein YncE